MDKERMMQNIFVLSLAFAGITIYAFIMLAEHVNIAYAYGTGISIIFFVSALKAKKKKQEYLTMRSLKENWGKEINRKRELSDIKVLFSKLSSKNKENFYIDDQTWFDLNMDKIFTKVDRTLSTLGEQLLYYTFRKPLFDMKDLIKRANIINLFQKNKDYREKIQYHLSNLGIQRKDTVTELVWGDSIIETSNILKYATYIMSYVSKISVLLIILGQLFGVLDGGKIFLLIMLILMINMIIHGKVKKEIGAIYGSIGYLGKIVGAANEISKIKIEDNNECLKDYIEILNNKSNDCKNIMRKLKHIEIGRIEGIDVILDYIYIFFLEEAKTFFTVIDSIKLHIDDIRELYLCLGEIDALISVASYRESLENYSEPVLEHESKTLKAIELNHPLLEKSVPNSLEMNKGVIITGSNMSGKSTFLRTIGVNVLFAQTIYTTLSKLYEGDYFKLITSINVSDNISSGKSYYLGEAEALHRIIKALEEEKTVFALIDEIFRGTNPVERINASAEILKYLAIRNSLTTVATHDLEITKMVDDLYECYYFLEDVSEEGLKFNYIIHKGVSSTRNAIKLLEFMGYPKEIIDNTNARIYKNS